MRAEVRVKMDLQTEEARKKIEGYILLRVIFSSQHSDSPSPGLRMASDYQGAGHSTEPPRNEPALLPPISVSGIVTTHVGLSMSHTEGVLEDHPTHWPHIVCPCLMN